MEKSNITEKILNIRDVSRNATDGICFISNGGHGKEAQIFLCLCNNFPGIGGDIITDQEDKVAVRFEIAPSEKPGNGFLRHAIIKKIEDYFLKTGAYHYPHIPRPYGSFQGGYIYQWTQGIESFPWKYKDSDGTDLGVKLDDWDLFTNIFLEAGFDLKKECVDLDDMYEHYSKNIIYESNTISIQLFKLTRAWKRIDFGPKSVEINYDKLSKYLSEKEIDLKKSWKSGRYEFVRLAIKYLTGIIKEEELVWLEQETFKYRKNSLKHLSNGIAI